MPTASKIRGILISAAIAAAAGASLPAAAGAATVEYRNDTPVNVPNNTGIAGVTSTLAIPAGRTPVQSIEVPGVKPFWSSGGTDLELRLKDPSGTEMNLMVIGCPAMPNTTNFTITDSASVLVDSTVAFCNNELNGGSGKPNDPMAKTLAFFNGKPSSGNWTLAIRDTGIQAGGGILNGWGLRITHAPFVPTITAKKQKLGKSVKFTAACNADCTLTTGGDAKAKTEQLNQDNSELLSAKLKKKARKRLAKRGKAKLKVSVDDGYGDVVTKTVKVKFKRKRVKGKSKR
jgi:hypothetical protein